MFVVVFGSDEMSAPNTMYDMAPRGLVPASPARMPSRQMSMRRKIECVDLYIARCECV
jgi:hypothetical protein